MATAKGDDPSAMLEDMNLVFTGNPGITAVLIELATFMDLTISIEITGTGKTFVARKFGALFKRLNLLYKGHVIETTPAKLTDKYMGGTAPKVSCLPYDSFTADMKVICAYPFHRSTRS